MPFSDSEGSRLPEDNPLPEPASSDLLAGSAVSREFLARARQLAAVPIPGLIAVPPKAGFPSALASEVGPSPRPELVGARALDMSEVLRSAKLSRTFFLGEITLPELGFRSLGALNLVAPSQARVEHCIPRAVHTTPGPTIEFKIVEYGAWADIGGGLVLVRPFGRAAHVELWVSVVFNADGSVLVGAEAGGWWKDFAPYTDTKGKAVVGVDDFTPKCTLEEGKCKISYVGGSKKNKDDRLEAGYIVEVLKLEGDTATVKATSYASFNAAGGAVAVDIPGKAGGGVSVTYPEGSYHLEKARECVVKCIKQ